MLSVFAGAVGVSAQSGAIGVSPAYPKDGNERSRGIFIHSGVDPGTVIEDGVTVVNNTEEDVTVLVGGVDTVESVGGSFACQQEAEKQTKVGKWFSFEEDEFEITAGDKVVVDFTIKVPKDVSPGEHNGCVVVRQKPSSEGDKADSGINLSYRSGIRMSITVSGDIKKELTFSETEIERLDSGNYSVWPKAKNTGNVSLDVKARTQLSSLFGGQSPVKEAQYPIFPDATGTWKFEFDRPYWGGIYKARTSISYNANAKDSLGEGATETKRLRHETGWFVMLPAMPALLVDLGALLLIISLPFWLLWRRRRKKVIKKRSDTYIVQSGDSLASIAEAHGTSWKRVAKVNKLQAPYQISVGDELLVPSAQVRKIKASTAVATAKEPLSTSEVESINPQSTRQTENEDGRRAEPVSSSWVSPRESTYGRLYDDSDDVIPDWREGADPEEVSKIEHLEGIEFSSRIRDSITPEEERKAPSKRKTAKKTSKKRR